MKHLPIILALALCSCGSGYHLRMAKKHIKKAEQKGAVITPDTVFKQIRVEVPSVRVDTAIVTEKADTVYLEKDHLKVRVIRKTDTLLITGECDTVTVVKEVPVAVSNEIEDGSLPIWVWVVIGGLCILIFGAVMKR